MVTTRYAFIEIDSSSHMHEVFDAIRLDVYDAVNKASLTELYQRASTLVMLAHAPSWRKRYGRDVGLLRKVGRREFRRTAELINRRAEEIGEEPDYDEDWGE